MTSTGLPSEVLAGPYGFMVVIAICLFWGLREWRKGREQDVAAYRKRAEEAEARRETAETKCDQEAEVLTAKIENLQRDARGLRDQHYHDLELTTAKYYAARQQLMALGVSPDQIP